MMPTTVVAAGCQGITTDAGADADTAAAPWPLFQREDGSAMRFYVRPGPAKAELAPLIQRGGGQLCHLQEPGAVLLAQSGEVPPGATGDFISTRYITDCVARGERLPLENYRLEPRMAFRRPSTAGESFGAGRMPFTEAEDRAILLYVCRAKGGRAAGAGNALWKDMARAQVTAHSWQAMRDRYLKQLQGREEAYLLAPSPKRRALAPAPADRVDASQSKEAMAVAQEENPSHIAERSKAPSIFQLANQEFEEGSEGESETNTPSRDTLLKPPETRRAEEASVSPKVQVMEPTPSEDSAAHQNQSLEEDQMTEPSSEQVTMAIEDMQRFMEEFGVDLATVTQAFLKTSGEVAAVAQCLRSSPHSEDCPPLWTRQDDLDLLTGSNHLRSKLIAKFGEENVNRRVAFRRT